MTEEFLQEAARWAELPLKVDELAFMLGMTPDELRLAISDRDNKLGQTIKDAQVRSRAELYEAVFLLAKQGSGPAQLEALRLIKEMDR